jgi:putative NIF3 family GTP cyclohydrolase 1 type 2
MSFTAHSPPFLIYFLTDKKGEMGHHELLEASSKGVNVILTDHSNSERGWLHHYKELIEGELRKEPSMPPVVVHLSHMDHDPLFII